MSGKLGASDNYESYIHAFMLQMASQTFKMSSGHTIPTVGLGTWKSKPGEVKTAVEAALACGYRHLDCAFAYNNEDEVGNGLEKSIKDGVVKREEVFITSKLWNTFHRPDLVKKNCQISMDRLKVSYLDLYLMHWPMAYIEDREPFPKDENGQFIFSDVDYLDTYKAMEGLVKEGLVKSIGLSNCNSKQIQRILDNCEIPPANLQVEISAYFPNERLVDFCHSKGISVTAYSPLGSPDRPWAKPGDPLLLEEKRVADIATRVGKTPAQVLLRWLIQRNVIVIPKSVTPARIQSNFELFDFELSSEDMTTLSNFGVNYRGCHLNWVDNHPLYPFHEAF